MRADVVMPQLGESVTEGAVVKRLGKGEGDGEGGGSRGRAPRGAAPPTPAPPRAEPPKEPRKPAPPPPEKEGPKVRISPVVAKMTAEHGIDVSPTPGTGVDGRGAE